MSHVPLWDAQGRGLEENKRFNSFDYFCHEKHLYVDGKTVMENEIRVEEDQMSGNLLANESRDQITGADSER